MSRRDGDPLGRERSEPILAVSQSLRELAKLGLLQASRIAAEKSPAEAWPWCRAVLRSSRHVGRHVETIGRMIGIAIHSITVEPVLRWSSRPELSATDLRRALADVVAIDEMTAPHLGHTQGRVPGRVQIDGGEHEGWTGVPFWLFGSRESVQEALNLIYANWLSQVDRPRFRRLPGEEWQVGAVRNRSGCAARFQAPFTR